ncbi:ATP-binding protein [Paractinoplanes maris]|uniref:ATP-binding protein n=1 Tax=Paractinoplanes maris TaxID=1734446 RepID=UPI00202124B1|nr:ATP-binding protein [Actinoplanes maris]
MTEANRLISTMTINRVLELPRRPPSANDDPAHDVGRRRRLAGIVSAYHGAASLLLGWRRPSAGAPIDVFSAGGIAGAAGEGMSPLSLPPGGRGRPYAPGELLDDLRAMPCWTRLAGLTDGLLTDEPGPDDDVRPTLDECLLHVWHAGFAWLVLAEPVPNAEILTVAKAVALEERQAQSKAQSPEQAVAAARLQRRHRELQQARSTGLWRVHLLAGGPSPAAATAVAGLLCASADLGRQPYVLTPTGVTGGFDEILARDDLPDSPALAGSPLLAALAVAPIEEVPGLRFALRPEFDLTPETGSGAASVAVGTVLDRNERPAGSFEVPRSSLNRHTFVCGATGAGKSQTVRNLLENAARQSIPWLVVEPAKAEYRQMADRIGGDRVVVVRPGDPLTPPAGFNPLRPAEGFPLQTHLDLTRSLFLAAFEAEEPFPQVLSAALTRCYEELGWDLTLSESRTAGHRPRYPTLGDLQRVADSVVEQIGYGREITDNVRGFIRVRLSSLRQGTTGRFFEGGHPLDFAELMRRNVVFEIEDVGDDRDKAFLMGGLLIQLTEHLRVEMRRDPGTARLGLRHLSVFEEAHRLLRRTEQAGPAAHAVELFAALLAEIRAYGEGLIIAEQIPCKLVPDVIKNTAVKIMHRLPAADDRDAVGATTNLTDRQSEFLVTLPAGTAAVFADGMDQPVLVRMPDGTAREQNGRTPTAAADPIIGRRSDTCGAECRAGACTLRVIRTAQRYREDHPWVTLWAEFAVLAHLTGKSRPVVWDEKAAELSALEPRLRDCVLSQAVDAAVATRSAVLGTTADPSTLAQHVTAAFSEPGGCRPEEPGFIAPAYRCDPILDALTGHEADDPADPRAAAWSAAIGRDIVGETIAEQTGWVRFWMGLDQADPSVRLQVAFGREVPSAIERAVGTDRSAYDWPDRLAVALIDALRGGDWIPDLLDAAVKQSA